MNVAIGILGFALGGILGAIGLFGVASAPFAKRYGFTGNTTAVFTGGLMLCAMAFGVLIVTRWALS